MAKKRVPGVHLPSARVRASLEAALRITKEKNVGRQSTRACFRDSGLRHYGTFQRYLHKDMSEAAIIERARNRGPPRALGSAGEKVVAGWVLRRREKFRPVSGNDVRVFVREAFGCNVSASYVSKLLARHKITAHHTRGKDYRTRRSDLEAQVRGIIRLIQNKVRQVGGPSHVVSLDATGLWNGKAPRMSYGPQGAYAFQR